MARTKKTGKQAAKGGKTKSATKSRNHDKECLPDGTLGVQAPTDPEPLPLSEDEDEGELGGAEAATGDGNGMLQENGEGDNDER
jgi:hypothetical protein